MPRLLLLVLLALAALSSAAEASTARFEPVEPLPAPSVFVVHGPCPDEQIAAEHRSCATKNGTIYLDHPKRLTLLHEIGHQFDFRWLRDRDRNAFMRMAGIEGLGWEAGASTPDYMDAPLATRVIPPRETFAEAYALCAAGVRPRGGLVDGRWGTGYSATARVHRKVCAFIRRVGEREWAREPVT